VGANNCLIHGELLKVQRELESALPAMASLFGIDPKRKFDLPLLCANNRHSFDEPSPDLQARFAKKPNRANLPPNIR
jgi:hypothetical protein